MKLKKITEREKQSPKRLYEDACATAHALDLLGERWAILVIRELMLGPKRFGDLRADLPGISANVLTQRLEGLEASGVVKRRKLPPPANIQVYELTEWGYESEPIFQAMGRWAARSPLHDPTLPFGTVSLVLSMRTMFDPLRADGLDLTVGLKLPNDGFVVRVMDGSIHVERGDPAEAKAVLTGNAQILAAAFYGGVPLADLEAGGALKLDGDREAAERLVSLFPLPSKAPTAE
ncbi:winged helix-turn-helix transcriptional regulator [Oryzicola mucosus]|uniref:Transcriptional regulator n=1 Tax=Oryzicola mucosus TaxID=2767425 RepID=A0A8J6PEQ5_9HYPH|nr:winged helix-turn-helix transcriptional regulator [Oryzicola mucosus]MBD0413599.1 transcriptional regulator [Oryzicola mucosus]